MAKKEYTYKGKTIEEMKRLSVQDVAQMLPARQRRTLKRGFTEPQKILLKKIRAGKKNIETHCRDMLIIPEMVGMNLKIHKGTKDWVLVAITEDMVGHYLGEFAQTRSKVSHSSPGIGATRSSAAISVR